MHYAIFDMKQQNNHNFGCSIGIVRNPMNETRLWAVGLDYHHHETHTTSAIMVIWDYFLIWSRKTIIILQWIFWLFDGMVIIPMHKRRLWAVGLDYHHHETHTTNAIMMIWDYFLIWNRKTIIILQWITCNCDVNCIIIENLNNEIFIMLCVDVTRLFTRWEQLWRESY